MKIFFCLTFLLFCAVFGAAQQIKSLDINTEIFADMALTNYDIAFDKAVPEGDFDFAPAANRTIIFDKDAPRARVSVEEKLNSEDGAYSYTLPLEFNQKIPAFSLRVDIMNQQTAPEIKETPLDAFKFAKWNNNCYTASFKAADYKPQGRLALAVPAEDMVKAYVLDSGGSTYFFAVVPAPAPILQSIKYDKSKFEEVYPKTPAPVSGALTIAGILSVKEASLDLNFTRGNKPAGKKRIYINKKNYSALARGVFEQAKATAAAAAI